MPFFIVTDHNLIVPGEHGTYESACAACEPGETVYIADSRKTLEETLEEDLCY